MKRACLVPGLLGGLLAGLLLVGGGGCATSAAVGVEEDGGAGDGGVPDVAAQQDAPPFFQDTAPLPDGYQDDAGEPSDAPVQYDGQRDGPLQLDAPSQQDAATGDAGTCYPEPDEAHGGDTCPDAIDKGSVTDVTSAHVVVTGNLWPAGDVDWYKVTFVDSPDNNQACDKFNARIAFTATGNPGGRYAFDVFLGNCVATPTCGALGGKTTALTSFSWDDTGECPCNAVGVTSIPNVHVCRDHSMVLTIRVFRVSGSPVCENYELALDNG